MTGIEGVFLQVAAALIAGALTGIAVILLSLTRHVVRMNTILAKLSTDFSKVQENYVSHADFQEVKEAFWALHDEHLRCKVCNDPR